MTSYIFYDGPSLLGNDPIVGVATFGSSNEKTGPVVQTYIIRKDLNPVEAKKTEQDHSHCGDCPIKKACYVLVHQGPNVIFKQIPKMQPLKLGRMTDEIVRIGAYGEGTAIPLNAWEPIFDRVRGWMGYTHQWRKAQFQDWKQYCQASTETVEGTQQAWDMGWKTYRVRSKGEPLLQGEINCPYPKVQCNQCKLCNGRKKNISIEVHGSWQPMRFETLKQENKL